MNQMKKMLQINTGQTRFHVQSADVEYVPKETTFVNARSAPEMPFITPDDNLLYPVLSHNRPY